MNTTTVEQGGSAGIAAHAAPPDDTLLLERIAAKDKGAFEQLYMGYHRRLFQFLFRMVHRPDVAEEVVNDVMFVVWEKAASFDGRSKVSTWILGIAYRKGLKALQKLKRRRETELEENFEGDELQDASWESNPEASLSNTEFTGQLKAGIDALSTEHRSVVELTVLGYSYGEIAAIVDCPANTVKTRMFYARRHLKKILACKEDAGSGPTNGTKI